METTIMKTSIEEVSLLAFWLEREANWYEIGESKETGGHPYEAWSDLTPHEMRLIISCTKEWVLAQPADRAPTEIR